MRKFRILFIIAAMLSTSSIFAGPDQDMSKACGDVAKACLDAGFARDESIGKKFWHECMKPLLLNKKVAGVTIDAATVNTCRTDKIDMMKKELNELEKVQKSH